MPVPVARAARHGGGRDHVGVVAVIDVDHRPEAALDHHAGALLRALGDQPRAVDDVRAELLAEAGVEVDHRLHLGHFGVELFEQRRGRLEAGPDLLAQHLRPQEIAHPHRAPADLIGERRPEPAPRRAAGALDLVAKLIDVHVMRQHHHRALTDLQLPVVRVVRVEHRQLVEEPARIDGHALREQASLAHAERAGGNHVEDEPLSVGHQALPRIEPARVLRHERRLGGQELDHVPFALVAELRTHHRHDTHSIPPSRSSAPIVDCGGRRRQPGWSRRLGQPAPTRVGHIEAPGRTASGSNAETRDPLGSAPANRELAGGIALRQPPATFGVQLCGPRFAEEPGPPGSWHEARNAGRRSALNRLACGTRLGAVVGNPSSPSMPRLLGSSGLRSAALSQDVSGAACGMCARPPTPPSTGPACSSTNRSGSSSASSSSTDSTIVLPT